MITSRKALIRHFVKSLIELQMEELGDGKAAEDTGHDEAIVQNFYDNAEHIDNAVSELEQIR